MFSKFKFKSVVKIEMDWAPSKTFKTSKIYKFDNYNIFFYKFVEFYLNHEKKKTLCQIFLQFLYFQ